MHEPSSGVIGGVGNDEPTVSGHVVNITARRVDKVQAIDIPVGIEVSWTANTKDVHVVTVKMDRVRKTACTVLLLNDPVCPLGRVGNVDQVVVLGVVLVTLAHILESRLSRVNDHRSAIDGPQNNRLVVGGDSPVVKSEVEVLGLNSESVLWHALLDLGHRNGVNTCGWHTIKRRSCRVSQSLTVIGEDRAADTFVGAKAWSVNFSAEPVVSSGLVGGEDNIVTLT